MRVAWREDRRDGRRHDDSGILVACDVRAGAWRCSATPCDRAVRHTCSSSTWRRHRSAAVRGRVRSRARGRAVLGSWHVRRDPDIRWRRATSDLPRWPHRQVALLMRAAAVVKPGGRLSTPRARASPKRTRASSTPFSSQCRRFDLVDLRRSRRRSCSRCSTTAGMLRTLPFAHGLEAFFAAALVRRGTRPATMRHGVMAIHSMRLRDARLERRQVVRCSSARSARRSSSSSAFPCAWRCARARSQVPQSRRP